MFLAAIMVLSVVAIGFTGAAAAQDESFANSDWSGNSFYEGQEVQVTGVDVDGTSNDDVIEVLEVTDTNNQGEPVDTTYATQTTVETGDISFDTSRLNGQGDYVLTNESGNYLNSSGNWTSGINNAASAELRTQDLSVEFDEDEADNTDSQDAVDLNVLGNRQTFYANVSAEYEGGSLDDSDLEEMFEGGVHDKLDDEDDLVQVKLEDADGTKAAKFNGSGFESPGELELSFEVNDTEVTDNATIQINDPGDAEVNVEDATVNQGGIAEITVSQNAASSGTVVIGDEEDVGYQANVSINDFADESEFTLYFNTYAAGSDTSGEVVWVDSDDTDVELGDSSFNTGASAFNATNNQTDIDSILAQGDYELTASSTTISGDYDSRFTNTQEEPDSVSQLFINERATGSVDLWTSSTATVEDEIIAEDDDKVGALKTQIDEGTITETDEVAVDDYAIHQLSTSGLDGILQSVQDTEDHVTNNEDALRELVENASYYKNSVDDTAIEFTIEETENSVGPNAEQGTVNFTATNNNDDDDYLVLHDEDEDQYFIAIDTEEAYFDKYNGPLADDDDHELNVDFAIRHDRLLDVDNDNDIDEKYEEAETTSFEVLERDGSFDLTADDQVEVEAAEDQQIEGETNIAPGSEVRVRVRGADGASFSKSQSEVVVDADGTFAADFDFSDRSAEEEFTATLRSVVTTDDDPEEDGLIVEQLTEEPDDETAPEDGNMTDDGNTTDDEMSDDEGMSDDGNTSDDGDTADDGSSDDTSEETPGFGAIVALVAVLGAALLATRRQN